MITRIEINGFKSFHNFGADLLPFQVFIGPNGVGKTNLFDAIGLLAALVGNNTLEEAFRQSRGELNELFTYFLDGSRAKLMSFAVEMLIARTVVDGSGKTRPVASNRLRYELDIEIRAEGKVERAYVVREGLLPIADANDKWVKDHIPTRTRKNWIVREKRPPYIATVEDKGQATIFRNQDAPGGGREAVNVGQIERTVLSASDAIRYPTIQAARQEMINWRFLQLNPYALRARVTGQSAAALLPDGSNLAAVLARMSRDNKDLLAAVLADMSKSIPDLKNLTVKPIPDHDEFLIEIETREGEKFSSRVLSDGTLRLLALTALKNDPQHRGVLCFEEPENGVQPLRLKQIVDVLHGLATNLSNDPDDRPLRQVLINTHSPGLLAYVPSDSLFFVGLKAEDKGRGTRITPVRPVLIADDSEAFYTWEQVKQYLDTDPVSKKREELGF